MVCSPPGSSVHGILQARILEWVAILFSRGSFWPRNWALVSYIADRRPILYHLWVRPMGKDPSLPSTTSHQGSPSLHLNLWEMDRLSPKVTTPPSIPRAQSEHHSGPQTHKEVFLWGCRLCRLEKAVTASQWDENSRPGLEGPPCRSLLRPSILNCLCPSSMPSDGVHPALALLRERNHHMLLPVRGSRAELHFIYLSVSPPNPYPWESSPMPGITHAWWTMAWMNTWIEPGLITSLCVPASLNWNIDFSTWMHNFEHWSLLGSTFPSVFWEEH